MQQGTAVIIGAGPAGLTAAYELAARTKIVPLVLESSDVVGGISRTINYKGNRIDIGGHRFFSKSDRVMRWWNNLMPIDQIQAEGTENPGWGPSSVPTGRGVDLVMLIRKRKSRIYFLRKFFDYPISLSIQTVRNLGLPRTVKILFSYVRARLFPIPNERNLEQFFVNRFGGELYRTFFKSYTEKVWGVPCREIGAAWGAQRIKELNIAEAVKHIFRRAMKKDGGIRQRNTHTSLVERFLYPKYGPGQMWERCAQQIEEMGGRVVLNQHVHSILTDNGRVTGVIAKAPDTCAETTYRADYVISSMPVKDLIRAFSKPAPDAVREVSEGLMYRDFVTVGLLLKKLKIKQKGAKGNMLLRDNWIYVQEPDVKVGRLQLFNNWSPYLVANPHTVWLGMEYFCNEGDAIWELSDEEMKKFACHELSAMGFIDECELIDATVIRVHKTYPAYFGSYQSFDEIRTFVDTIPNLFLIGRNGMHRYNNQDHSMLTAMIAVDNIIAGRTDKDNIWSVNTEEGYHEDAAEV